MATSIIDGHLSRTRFAAVVRSLIAAAGTFSLYCAYPHQVLGRTTDRADCQIMLDRHASVGLV